MRKNSFSLVSSFLIVAAMTISPAFAQVANEDIIPEIRKYGLITPPVCTTPQGEVINHYPGTSEQIVSFGGFLAAAGDFEVGRDGGIVNEDRIYYDETNMPYLHPLLQEFLFHHECAHITQGHLEIPPSQRQGMYFPLEQSADCAGLEGIRASSDNFARDAEIVITNFAFIAEQIMPASPGREDVRATFIKQRVDNMRACPVLQQ